jgi:hypothetical protein
MSVIVSYSLVAVTVEFSRKLPITMTSALMHPVRFSPLVLALFLTTQVMAQPPAPGSSQTARPLQALGVIQGNALNSNGGPLPNANVRLRDARTGRIVASSTTDKTGLFAFRPVEPGTYIVELVADDHKVLAASQILNVNAAETISAVVKLPFSIKPFAGVLGHTVPSAILVTATAAATGILASQVTGEPVSPRR